MPSPSNLRVAHRFLERDAASGKLDRERLKHLFNPGPNDWGRKQNPGSISISWVSEKAEDRLRTVGFDFPTRAQGSGKITYKGRVVGHASNFSGLVFNKPEALEPIWKNRRLFESIGFWWTNEPWREQEA
jgi:hypothetical protein